MIVLPYRCVRRCQSFSKYPNLASTIPLRRSFYKYSIIAKTIRIIRIGSARSHSNTVNWSLLNMYVACRNFMKRDDGTSLDRLKDIYKSKLLPLENRYLFHEFHLPPLTDQDFDAKPMVLFVGQYSTGKTSMIK